jgi:CMD domain protein
LHAEPATREFYSAKLDASADRPIVAAVDVEIARGRTQGPYGAYPPGPLSGEDRAGLIYRVSDEGRRTLGARLAAAFEHAHLLVFRPRDADPAALQGLVDAGWSTNDIVTLSQLVAFLSFQIRAVGGLRALAAAPARSDEVRA